MSRTFKTDPYAIRAYRAERRPVDPDWRVRWDWQNSPAYGTAAWIAWLDDKPSLRPPYDWHRLGLGSAEDRRLAHRRYRALVRNLMAHERYDDVPAPRATKGWEDWAW